MSAAERKSKKIYYTMGEVSEMFDVNPSLIRFWEQKFDILKPDKNKKGNRLFTPADVENLKLIYHLVKENGMTLAGAQKRLKQNPEGLDRNLEIVERLQHIRAMLLEVRQELKGAGEETVEIFVDTEAVSDEQLAVSASSERSQARALQPEAPVVSQAQSCIDADPDADFDADPDSGSLPLVPFQLQQLWPEDEYSQPESCMEDSYAADCGNFPAESASSQDANPQNMETAPQDAVLDFGAGIGSDKRPEPVRPQVVEQTLF